MGSYSYGYARKPCLSCPRSLTTAGVGSSSRWKCGERALQGQAGVGHRGQVAGQQARPTLYSAARAGHSYIWVGSPVAIFLHPIRSSPLRPPPCSVPARPPLQRRAGRALWRGVVEGRHRLFDGLHAMRRGRHHHDNDGHERGRLQPGKAGVPAGQERRHRHRRGGVRSRIVSAAGSQLLSGSHAGLASIAMRPCAWPASAHACSFGLAPCGPTPALEPLLTAAPPPSLPSPPGSLQLEPRR